MCPVCACVLSMQASGAGVWCGRVAALPVCWLACCCTAGLLQVAGQAMGAGRGREVVVFTTAALAALGVNTAFL